MTRAAFPAHPLARAVLALPSMMWACVSTLRNRWYDRPGAALQVPVPVISVGNLTVGGTGKTPVVETICRMLLETGRFPWIVSRGYGGNAGKGPLRVSEGRGPIVASIESGDEPFQLASALPGVGVIVGSDRYHAALEGVQAGADCLVLDDGFQHRRLHRDLDLVLLDDGSCIQAAKILPAGPLREPFSGIGRAGLILLTGTGNDRNPPALLASIRRWNRSAPVVPAFRVPAGFIRPDRSPANPPDRAVAFCGIGSPGGFRKSLVSLGIEPVGFRAFPDHHRYRPEELRLLLEEAEEADAALVTTEKDLARLPPDSIRFLARNGRSFLALRIRIEFQDRDRVNRTVLDTLEPGRNR